MPNILQNWQDYKEVGVPPLEVDGNDITVGFDTLHDKGLFPIQVTDDPILPTRTKTSGNMMS